MSVLYHLLLVLAVLLLTGPSASGTGPDHTPIDRSHVRMSPPHVIPGPPTFLHFGPRTVNREQQAVLVMFDVPVDRDAVIREMERRHLRPATLEELTTYRLHLNALKVRPLLPVIALGTIESPEGKGPCVAALVFDGQNRVIHVPVTGTWGGVGIVTPSFLAIRHEII